MIAYDVDTVSSMFQKCVLVGLLYTVCIPIIMVIFEFIVCVIFDFILPIYIFSHFQYVAGHTSSPNYILDVAENVEFGGA